MPETVLIYLLATLGALYCAGLLILHSGLRKAAERSRNRKSASSPEALPRVSIVVSARNEEQNIGRLIACLTGQEYPREKLELILVDDRSEDGTWALLEVASQEHSFLKALRIADTVPGFAPKKRAIDTAIRIAEGEIILLTDADCTPPPTWVSTMVSYYDEEEVVGVIGYSPYRFDKNFPSLIRGMLALEYFSLFAVAAASAGAGRAATASGTNFSYRKQAYRDIGGFESVKDIISGDDDLLVNEMSRRKTGHFLFAIDPRAYVPAAAPKNWRQFWNQRIRYASKGKHYGGSMTLVLTAVFTMNLLLILGALGPLVGATSLLAASVGTWLVKSVIEFRFLSAARQVVHEQKLLRYFLPSAILHPLYITLFGFLGLFAKFRWKE